MLSKDVVVMRRSAQRSHLYSNKPIRAVNKLQRQRVATLVTTRRGKRDEDFVKLCVVSAAHEANERDGGVV
ncbi:hypothetical protein HBH53_246480 [Parastagonospora nodorum]|nr:hypothetical protein HBH53_246480 [Parastagonospora nodorum]KAH4215584.1 hypothetical protein HBI06_246080 [Parastagonospora nodorum]KAH4224346.1 hypothetical protein HBI05_239130 [Parastagonospora nodorum]KAH4914573.1 hypothetical protein HBH73_246610 [Parastagonospora nodorum]KAH5394522.1 hypothetical protein HBI47_239560 [Parastagonospora nodorum]